MNAEGGSEAGNVRVGISGGRVDVSGDIVGGDKFVYQAPSPVIPALHQLPAPPVDFTGREADLNELRTAIFEGATISGLHGQGGIGKTALALKLADEIKSQFPDAQIYLNLLGLSERPLTTDEAMSFVIYAFLGRQAKLPDDLPGLEAIYRSTLNGRRVLLLLDNARDAAQVKLLIPPRECCLLVTSRMRFTLPGLRAKTLETLSPADGEELLLKIAPRIDKDAGAIARHCGCLPQALRVVAGALAERVDIDPADYARRLAEEESRPKLLTVGNESLESSINLSYILLDAETRKRWRMLAVFPQTFGAAAAAAVWDVEAAAAHDTLSHLLQYSMLEWNQMGKRYRLHDLMRDFARQKLEVHERDDAAERHARYYLSELRSANALYLKGGASATEGFVLFDAERANIDAGQSWAARQAGASRGIARLCSDYPDSGAHYLGLREHPRNRVRWLEAALAASRLLGDRAAEARHMSNLGVAYVDLGEPRRAILHYEQSIEIKRSIGDRQGEANTLGNLGNAHAALGEAHQAIECHQRALAMDRENRDRRGEGQDLGNLGNAYTVLGEPEPALEYYKQSLAISREVGNRWGEGASLGGLGNGYATLGEPERAMEYFGLQLSVTREIGDKRGEGDAFWNMSLLLDKLGERSRAIENGEEALKMYLEVEDPTAEEVGGQLEVWRKQP
jgi:tetratricopeptide (TPR) repeat protein